MVLACQDLVLQSVFLPMLPEGPLTFELETYTIRTVQQHGRRLHVRNNVQNFCRAQGKNCHLGQVDSPFGQVPFHFHMPGM